MRGAMAGLMACGLMAFASAAQATPTARIIYSRTPGAESCPDETELRHAVAARVGYDPFFAWADKTIVATMTAGTPHGFSAQVDLVDEHGIRHGARELRTDHDCSELLEAAALAIAIAIDPQRIALRSAPSEQPGPEEQASPSSPVPETPATPRPKSVVIADGPAPPLASTLRIEGTAGPVASAGVAPEPTAGLALGLSLGVTAFSLAVEGRIDAPAWSPATGGGSGRVGTWLALASIVPCLREGPVFACALGQLGSMQASSEGVPIVRTESLPWRAVGGRFGVSTWLDRRVAVRVGMDLLGNLTPQRLLLNGMPGWTAPTASASLSAAVVLLYQ